MTGLCATCRDLLNEALNLSVRARKLDANQRAIDELNASSDPDGWLETSFRRAMDRHNARHPVIPMDLPKGCIVHPWVEEAYATDLMDWERRAKRHLMIEHEEITQ